MITYYLQYIPTITTFDALNAFMCFSLGFLISYILKHRAKSYPSSMCNTTQTHEAPVQTVIKTHDVSVQTVTKTDKLLIALNDIYNFHKKSKTNKMMWSFKSHVPRYIIDRVPTGLLLNFKKALDPPKKDWLATYYAIDFLNKYKDRDEVVINWLANKYDIKLHE